MYTEKCKGSRRSRRDQDGEVFCGAFEAFCFWYFQYCKISPRLKLLPLCQRRKNSIRFILSSLQWQPKAELVPSIRLGGTHAFDQTALPHNRRRPAGGSIDAVCRYLEGRVRLQLALQSVAVNGQNYDVLTTSHPRIGGDHKKRNWAWIGGGAAGGALIGALAGGGTGALIGGPVGAGAGTTVALLTGKKDIRLGAETPLTFKLAEPVTIDVKG